MTDQAAATWDKMNKGEYYNPKTPEQIALGELYDEYKDALIEQHVRGNQTGVDYYRRRMNEVGEELSATCRSN